MKGDQKALAAMLSGEHVAEAYGSDVRYADSTIQEAGGHKLHVEGGAEVLWKQVGNLTLVFRTLCDEIDRMRAYTCPKCGEPGAITMPDESPFLKHAISQEAMA